MGMRSRFRSQMSCLRGSRAAQCPKRLVSHQGWDATVSGVVYWLGVAALPAMERRVVFEASPLLLLTSESQGQLFSIRLARQLRTLIGEVSSAAASADGISRQMASCSEPEETGRAPAGIGPRLIERFGSGSEPGAGRPVGLLLDVASGRFGVCLDFQHARRSVGTTVSDPADSSEEGVMREFAVSGVPPADPENADALTTAVCSAGG